MPALAARAERCRLQVVFFIDFDSIVEDEACGPARGRREIEIIKTTYDISLDSQISLLPRGFSPPPVGGPKADEVAVPLGSTKEILSESSPAYCRRATCGLKNSFPLGWS